MTIGFAAQTSQLVGHGLRAMGAAFALLVIGFPCAADILTTPSLSLSRPPLYEGRTRTDPIGRILVPVMVNHRGPFQFVLDTGANSTVLTPKLVATLGSSVAGNDTVTISGVTGSASVSTVVVDLIEAGGVVLGNQRLPVADALSNDTDGVLGADALAGTCVLVDLLKSTIVIRHAHHEEVMDGLTRIHGQFRFGRLLVVRASVGRVPVKAVIDTGSEYTLGNSALQRRLGIPARAGASDADVDVVGETLKRQIGERRQVQLLRMGNLQVPGSNIVFGDFYVFKLWGLESEPAIVLGMDILGGLDTFVIDYQRGEIQVRPRSQL